MRFSKKWGPTSGLILSLNMPTPKIKSPQISRRLPRKCAVPRCLGTEKSNGGTQATHMTPPLDTAFAPPPNVAVVYKFMYLHCRVGVCIQMMSGCAAPHPPVQRRVLLYPIPLCALSVLCYCPPLSYPLHLWTATTAKKTTPDTRTAACTKIFLGGTQKAFCS